MLRLRHVTDDHKRTARVDKSHLREPRLVLPMELPPLVTTSRPRPLPCGLLACGPAACPNLKPAGVL